MARLLGALVLLVIALAPRDVAIAACSCGGPSTMELGIRAADAAVVGEVDGSRLMVETVVRGPIDRASVPITFTGGCSGTPADQRQLFLLERNGSGWRGNDCMVFPAESINGLIEAPPAPEAGRIAYIVSGRFGTARLAALDAAGQPVAYGIGEGRARLVTCPDDLRIIEIVGPDDPADFGTGVTIEVRDLATFETVSRHGPGSYAKAWCLSPGADEILVEESQPSTQAPPTARLLRLRAGGTDVVLEGGWASFDVDRGSPLAVAVGAAAWDAPVKPLALFEVATGRIVDQFEVRGDVDAAALSPDGQLLALHAPGRAAPFAGGPGARPAALFLVESGSGRVIGEQTLESHDLWGALTWLSDDEFVFVSTGAGDAMVPSRSFDRDLREQRRYEELPLNSVEGNRAIGLFSPSGGLPYGGSKLSINLLDLGTGETDRVDVPGTVAQAHQVVAVVDGPSVADGARPGPVFEPRLISSNEKTEDAESFDWRPLIAASLLAMLVATFLIWRRARRLG